MRKHKGQIIFDGPLDLKREIKRQIKPMLDDMASKAKQEAVGEALELMLPIACNCIYEAYGFNKKRLKPFLEYFATHIECLDSGVTTLDDYRKWCKDNGIKYIEMEDKDNDVR